MSQLTDQSFTYDDDKTLAYLEGGRPDAPLLIFLHGWPGIAWSWKPQLEYFMSKGFRVVAPDMPGYGRSSSRHVYEDYTVESLVKSQLALLSHLNRTEAVWVAHDWGTAPMWGLANHHPEVVRAAVGLAVPYHSMEMGLEELLKWVNRDIYPEDRYPYGQWSYMAFYEQSFDQATKFIEKDPAGFLRRMYHKGNPDMIYKPAATADTVRDGGRFGGASQPPSADETPDDGTVLKGHVAEETIKAFERTGFWGPNAWYVNSKTNRAYALDNWLNDGVLDMPVLFIEAKYDNICATASSDITKPQKAKTKDLTYVSIDAGHHLQLETPDEVNETIASFLQKKVENYWTAAGQS